jgi:hypothetical protein
LVLAKLLGVGDLLAVIVLLFSAIFPQHIITWIATFIILKGVMFGMMKNFVSYIDVVVGIYIVFVGYGISHWVPTLGSALFLGQKGLFSLV